MHAGFRYLRGCCRRSVNCMCLTELDLGVVAGLSAYWRRRRLHVRHTLIGGEGRNAYDYMVCPAMALPSFRKKGEVGKTKKRRKLRFSFCLCSLDTFDFTGTQATRANANRARASINHHACALEVGYPGAARFPMGVADLVSGVAPFLANGTYPRHGMTPPFHFKTLV